MKTKIKEKDRLEYFKRNVRLEILGYPNYQAYLKSDDWRILRKEILENDPNCFLCAKKANQVHHMFYTYRVLLGIDKQWLIPLCHSCHEDIEIDKYVDSNGFQRKQSLTAARRRINRKRWSLNIFLELPIGDTDEERREIAKVLEIKYGIEIDSHTGFEYKNKRHKSRLEKARERAVVEVTEAASEKLILQNQFFRWND